MVVEYAGSAERPPERVVSKNLLFIPGPVTVAESVLAATAQPMIDHRGPEFKALLDRIAQRMTPMFGTRSAEVLLLGASGTGGLEAAVGNLFGPGDRLLACPIGVFGERLDRDRAHVRLRGRRARNAVGRRRSIRPRCARSSTRERPAVRRASCSPTTRPRPVRRTTWPRWPRAMRGHDAYVVVDSVSGLAASEFRMDEWGFDVVVTASQKALACPPGWRWSRSRRARGSASTPTRRAALLLRPAQGARVRRARSDAVDAAGLDRVRAGRRARRVRGGRRRRRCTNGTRGTRARSGRAAQALGLELFSRDGAHSPTVVAIRVPGRDRRRRDPRVAARSRAASSSAAVKRKLKGKIIRIGTMGDLTQTDVLGALGALEIALLEAGAPHPRRHRHPGGAQGFSRSGAARRRLTGKRAFWMLSAGADEDSAVTKGTSRNLRPR